MDITVDNITSIAARLNFAGYDLGASYLDIQISPRHDFQFCPCPIFRRPGGIGADYTANGLNQRQNYYVRAREVSGAGVANAWTAVVGFRTSDGAAQDLTPPAIVTDAAVIMRPEPVFNIMAH